jgi:hypothetical protein
MKPAHDADQDATLLAWWLDELDAEKSNEVEEHLFSCEVCSARLRQLLRLREAVCDALSDGHFGTVVTAKFIRSLTESGTRIREYRLPPGGSVLCTIAPQDDFVVSHLQAPLEGVRQLDLVIEAGDQVHRLAHVPFDAMSNEVTFIPPVATLRRLGQETQRLRLLAVTLDSERVLGEYTFNHQPWA